MHIKDELMKKSKDMQIEDVSIDLESIKNFQKKTEEEERKLMNL